MKKIKYILLIALSVALSGACAGKSKSAKSVSTNVQVAEDKGSEVVQPALYDYRIVKQYPHSKTSYTQGLQLVDGVMWEGTGQNGRSHLQRIDLNTGEVDIVATLTKDEFGEGITHFKEQIYQLTWLSNIAHVYDKQGNHLKTIRYKGEGWGITTDGEHLYMSDGTSVIRRINPDTFKTEKSICVTLGGQPLELINELEWIDGKIWANVYMTYSIVVIDPETGVVEGYVDMPELYTYLDDNPEAEAFNGIAYDATTGHIFVTGKDWCRLFEVEVIR